MDEERFYRMIEPTLVEFSVRRGVHQFEAWHQDEPAFLLNTKYSREALNRSLQLFLRADGETAVVRIDAVAFRDGRADRRFKTIFVASGELPRDAERVKEWLEAAWMLLLAVRNDDLLAVEEWGMAYQELTPIFASKK